MAESLLFVLIKGSKLKHLIGKGTHIALWNKPASRTICADYTTHSFAHVHRYRYNTMRLCLNQTQWKSLVL